MAEAKVEVRKITKVPEKLLICTEEVCEKINKNYEKLEHDQKVTVYALYIILENSIEHFIAQTGIEPKKITVIDVIYPERAGGKLGLSRARACEYLKSFYGIDISETTLKRLLNDKLYTSYEDFVKAVIQNVIAKREKKAKEEAKEYIIPTSWEEFINRPLIKNMVEAMKGKVKEAQINRVISEFYRYCLANIPEKDVFPVAPEWVVDKASSPNPADREKVWTRTDKYLNWRVDSLKEKGFEPDINTYIALLQAIQKWLGIRLLRPGTTQQEYKGKYETAEIPFEVRNIMVMDLLELWKEEKDKIYLKIIQGLILLYYTGSRRMVLIRTTGEPRLRIDFTGVLTASWDKVIKIYGEREFYRVSTLEKRGIKWTKIIPKSWGDLLRKFELFSEDEMDRATRILRKVLKKHMEELNEDTRKYLEHGKVWHVWRHTSNREALKAFDWNYSIVAKLLGWVKESNLKIYGDYEIDEIFGFAPERAELKFCSDSLKREIERELKRAGLL